MKEKIVSINSVKVNCLHCGTEVDLVETKVCPGCNRKLSYIKYLIPDNRRTFQTDNRQQGPL